ncbi:MAG: M23 family metallopeptidase [Oscillospiraceae bacterium]|jgi:hypothetical protein|nr:M23 family metallopeptidase [Oscillospiraceae bacterium]
MERIKRRSFYIALSVCILAICAAGWSTYKSVVDYIDYSRINSNSDEKYKRKFKETLVVDKEIIEKPEDALLTSSAIKKEEDVKAVSATGAEELKMHAPLEGGEITKCFSDAHKYSEEFKDWRCQLEIEIEPSSKYEVFSASKGKVSSIDKGSVTVLCEGNKISYSGLKSINVKKGQEISEKEKIGTISNPEDQKTGENRLLRVSFKNKEGKFEDPCKALPCIFELSNAACGEIQKEK